MRKGTWRTSYPLLASWRQGKWFELYSRCPITMLWPGPAAPNWAATSPAAEDTDGISAISAASAPISLATADRAAPAACSPRL